MSKVQEVVEKALAEIGSNPDIQKLIGPGVYLLGHGVLYPRTVKGTAVIQKLARGEAINKREAYRLLSAISSLTVLVHTTVHQTTQRLNELDGIRANLKERS